MEWKQMSKGEKIVRVVFLVIMVSALSEAGNAMRTIIAIDILPWHETLGLVLTIFIFGFYSCISYMRDHGR